MSSESTVVAMRIHELKCWPKFFSDVVSGDKTFEIRRNDRGFKTGDVLHLREFDSDTAMYTGNHERFLVTYITDSPWFVISGFVVMAIVPYREKS